MTQTRALKLLLISSALATVAACGGGSSSPETPTAGSPAQATETAGVAGQTTDASATGTPGSGGPSSGTAASDGGSSTSDVPSPSVPPPDITVLPDGTATNAEGTPVALPTAEPAGSAVAAPSAQATAGVSSGAVISIAATAPAEAAGDFLVDVKLDGVTKPYLAFNIYVTFDPTILTAVVIKPGTALARTTDETFCVRAPAAPGAVGLGCTVLHASSTATNGVLATIKFHPAGTGTTRLHLRSVAEGAATTGTYIATPRPGAQPLPDTVTLIDGSVTLP